MQLVKDRPSELLIRPGGNDHQVIADLLAPGGARIADGRPVISRLVLDAHSLSRRSLFVEAAAAAGIPCFVDPLTHLLQGDLRPEDKWVGLPFGRAKAMVAPDFSTDSARDELVAAVVDFEVEAGATAVIPPYLYLTDPTDPWLPVALDLISRTASYMREAGIRLPILPVFCGQLQSFGNPKNWAEGIDRWTTAARQVGADQAALCLSPTGAADDTYHRVLRLFEATRRVLESGIRVISWRQGIYGPALTTIGAHGYETGIGISEQTRITDNIASRKPKPDGRPRRGGAVPGIYLEPIGRSVTTTVAAALLGDMRMRPKVMCDDEACCPNGPQDTLDHRREHAIRSRVKALSALDSMPQPAWRLQRVARDARAAATLITQANQILAANSIDDRIKEQSSASLAMVAEYFLADATQATG